MGRPAIAKIKNPDLQGIRIWDNRKLEKILKGFRPVNRAKHPVKD